MKKRGRTSVKKARRGELRSTVFEPRAARRRRAAIAVNAGLDGGERLRIVETLLKVLEGAYCHLHQKRAAYAADPVQALQLLRTRAAELSEAQFHLEITSIITGLRDAHTRYSGPSSTQAHVKILPFLVEQYGPVENPHYVVSKVSKKYRVGDPSFVPGVALESWNGIPFAKAVELHAQRDTGGRPDSRIARALETLTFRALEFGPPPDEDWVIIGYRTDSARREVRIPWREIVLRASPHGHKSGSRASRFMAVNLSGEQLRRARKELFSTPLWDTEQQRIAQARKPGWVKTRMQDVLAARDVEFDGLKLGYLRVWSFDVEDDDAFLREVIRLLDHLSPEGLILDLRGNPGGLIWAAERMLQLFTPRTIVPTRFSLIATPLTRAIAQSPFNRLELQAWADSLEAAVWTGEPYSQPLPMTEPSWCNDLGQHYGGPTVCIVDANTYSSGDIFAAGFVDNEIGPLVSVGNASGGGGANIWQSADMREVLADTPFAVDALPHGVRYTMAIRRVTRVGAAEGLPIEDVGIPGIPYAMTREDLLHENRDLLAFASKQLDRWATTKMQVKTVNGRLSVSTLGLDELEVYVDGRPVEAARRIPDGAQEHFELGAGAVEIIGRRAGTIRQRRRITI